MKNTTTLLVAALFAWAGCSSPHPEGVEETLKMAGENRPELEKVLEHYRQRPEDSLKYRAACFLVEHMKWHASAERTTPPTPALQEWISRIDSMHRYMTRHVKDIHLYSPQRKKLYAQHTQVTSLLLKAAPVDTPRVEKGYFPDPQHVNAAFLTSQIDHAFQTWKTSPHARHLSFEQFREMILPYRTIIGYPFYANGKELNKLIGYHIHQSDQKTLERFATRFELYGKTIYNILSPYTRKPTPGLFHFFTGKQIDCLSTAHHACAAFRAYGIPAAVDYNLSFRAKGGRHFHTILRDSAGNTLLYKPGNSIDTLNLANIHGTSMFRNTFGAQSDSPFLLRGEGEKVPDAFNTPCIREVTAEYYRVAPVKIPLQKTIPNRVVYLYTFAPNGSGLVPATWGTVDTLRHVTHFPNAVPNVVYFPIYLQGDRLESYAEPFYFTLSDSLDATPTIVPLQPEDLNQRGPLTLLRKFPRKIFLQQRGEKMVGGRFEGANRADFSDAVLLATIDTPPPPYLQELTPRVVYPFRYYRYVAPKDFPQSSMATLEFLSEESHTNAPATPLPVLSTEAINSTPKIYTKVLPDTENYPHLKHSLAYDNNILTFSNENPLVMPLTHPTRVVKIRFAPANAANHVEAGHLYELRYWDKSWQSAGTRVARYNFLTFEGVPLGRLYWLRDLTTGKEELPFLYRNGRQYFIYHDTIIPRETTFLPLKRYK